jgi:hypothetical protein
VREPVAIKPVFYVVETDLRCKNCWRRLGVLSSNHRPILFPTDKAPTNFGTIRWPTQDEFDEGVPYGAPGNNVKCTRKPEEVIDFSHEGEIEVLFG